MARGSIMLQLEVTQVLDVSVTSVAPIFVQAFELLSAGRTTVREIAMEKIGGIAASRTSGLPFDISSSGYARLRLIFSERDRGPVIFLAPSHVASPQIDGAGLAILDVIDAGFSVTSPGFLVGARRIGAHAYLDEIDIT
jgi:hypothetical protein